MEDHRASKGWVHVLPLALGVAAIILLTKLTTYLAPYDWYFSFEDLLYNTRWATVVALLIKIAIPLVVGLIIGLFWIENLKFTAACIGFLASLILTWPAIVAWDLFHPELGEEKRTTFLVIYLIYFVSYAYLTIAGARLTAGKIELGSAGGLGERIRSILANLTDPQFLKDVVKGIICTVVATVIGKLLAG